jgi:two-component system CheB/CheR fusion protein
MLQREIRAANGRLYLLRVLPYAVRENAPRGAVATFVDITVLRDAERLQAVLDSLPEHVACSNCARAKLRPRRRWRALRPCSTARRSLNWCSTITA